MAATSHRVVGDAHSIRCVGVANLRLLHILELDEPSRPEGEAERARIVEWGPLDNPVC
jgi:hypothetical protein